MNFFSSTSAEFGQNYYLHGPDSIVRQNVLVVESHDEVTKTFCIGRGECTQIVLEKKEEKKIFARMHFFCWMTEKKLVKTTLAANRSSMGTSVNVSKKVLGL